MLRVAFNGVPGAGKTSLARMVAANARHIEGLKNVELVSEYARRQIAKTGIKGPVDQCRILNKQLDWEDTVGTCDLMLTDSMIFLGFVYAIKYRDVESAHDTMYVTDLFKACLKLNSPKPRYDLVVHLPPKFKPVEDGIRRPEQFDQKWREEADQDIRAALRVFPPGMVYEAKGDTIESRCEEVLEVIQQLVAR